ncbi:MAG TPA: methyltransferase domain-containing protein [Polyangiaceae bacterium]
MHAEAYRFVETTLGRLPPRRAVIELGSLYVNGSVRPLFGACDYVGLDSQPGRGVDVVGDAASWRPEPARTFDTVVCTEVLEHTPSAEQICSNARELLEPNGVLILTAASIGRAPHSSDGGPLHAGEFYRNVSPILLEKWLRAFSSVVVDTSVVSDVYALAIK